MNPDPDPRNAPTDADPRSERETGSRHDYPPVELRSVVVEYEERSDRRTVYPEGLASVERMSTWLTADDDAFVALDAVR